MADTESNGNEQGKGRKAYSAQDIADVNFVDRMQAEINTAWSKLPNRTPQERGFANFLNAQIERRIANRMPKPESKIPLRSEVIAALKASK